MTQGSSGGGWLSDYDATTGTGYLVGVTSTVDEIRGTANTPVLGQTALDLYTDLDEGSAMASNRRMRVTASALGALLAVSALAGCANLESFGIDSKVQPWAVANHDDKLSYHSEAGDALLNLDTTTGLAELETFQAVGYHHVESPDSSLHMEYETSVDGELRLATAHERRGLLVRPVAPRRRY